MKATTKRQSATSRWRKLIGRFRGEDRKLAVLRSRKVVPLDRYRRIREQAKGGA